MTNRVRAYRCGDHRLGQDVRRERGLRVGATIGDALAQWANRDGSEYGTCWPVQVYEGSVEDHDVLATEAHEMRVRAWRCERAVPLSEAFGPRTDEVLGFVEGVERLRWLRPSARAGVTPRVAALVAEHYAALADYGRVLPRPLHLVGTWHEARDLRRAVEPRPECANVAIKEACSLGGGTGVEVAAQVVQHRVVRLAFFGTWQAAWQEAGRSAATGIHALPFLQLMPGWEEHSRVTATRVVEALATALGAAREPAWSAAWDAAYDLFTYAPGDVPRPEEMFASTVHAAQGAFARAWPDRPRHGLDCTVCANGPALRNHMVAEFILHTSNVVFTVAVEAAQVAGWRAPYLVKAVQRLDPWRPLIDIWHLGGLPLGPTKHGFVVFLPEPRN